MSAVGDAREGPTPPGFWDSGLGNGLRRTGSILGVHLALVLLLISAPLWVPALALLGLFQRGSFPALRCFLYLTWLMAFESVGVLTALVLGLLPRVSEEVWLARHFRLQHFWVGRLFAGAQSLLGIRLQVDGGEALARGKAILLVRHASVVDALLPDLLAGRAHGLHMRYVLKRELRIDPCIDIVGHRLPNAFVRRGSGDSASEIERVKALAEGLGEGDGVVLFPEGTRFTEARRQQILSSLAEKGDTDRHRVASALVCTLPPRLGGFQGLAETDPEADVVVCAHTGTEKLTLLGDLIRGSAQGTLLKIKCWRVPAAEISREPDALKLWLDDEWRKVDRWVQAHAD